MSYDNLVVVLAVSTAIPFLLALAPRLPIPSAVLELVVGIVLGPAVLNAVRADTAVTALATIGLGFLLFLAGLEIDTRQLRGVRARLVGIGLVGTLALAAVAGWLLTRAGAAEDPLLIGTALTATSLGLLVPVLKDSGTTDRPVGQLTIGGASAGEVLAIVLLALFFSEHSTSIGSKLLLLLSLVALAATVVAVSLRAKTSTRLTHTVNTLADTSAQVRVRLSMLLVVGASAIAMRFGFEAILGTFIAGAALRLIDPDPDQTHPQFHTKLNGMGYGFLVPVFFVTSGIQFNLGALFANASTVLRVPLFLAALLLARGLPALLYRSGGLTRTESIASGLLQATSLPVIVAAATIGLRLNTISSATASALIAAGLLSVVLFPPAALALLRGETRRHNAQPTAVHHGGQI
ncbi:cation:proton antiporter [Streptomyces sp. AK02-01A]|uniref:cation:proton antiporter n=1 Tax=Streptomyces sp. AK02-01A TaxID=3028648 RepID=UPI0029AE6121|nr:cation:proton antiporter [Streptomyces sp. AK02-01A]MDX3855227.1 cation:proton antiporter [Streptomyces sp. AK02-01A]